MPRDEHSVVVWCIALKDLVQCTFQINTAQSRPSVLAVIRPLWHETPVEVSDVTDWLSV